MPLRETVAAFAAQVLLWAVDLVFSEGPMSVKVPAYIETLQLYVPGKPIEETRRELGLQDVIKLASNENPLGPSPLAVQAIAASLDQMHLYPDGTCFHLKRRLAAHLGVSPEELIMGNGSNELIELLVRTFLGPDDEGVICQGSFVAYKLSLHGQGKRYVEVPMKDRRYDLEAMAERVGPKTRLVFVANPDNPTGTWIGSRALERFLEAVKAKNPETLVVLDEAYFEYVTDTDYSSSLRYHAHFPSLVTLRTFSKVYGLAALRLGYGVLSPVLARYLDRTRMPFNVNALAQIGGLAALDDHEHVRQSQQVNQTGRRFLGVELPKLGLELLPSQANFVFVDFRRPAAPLYDKLLRQGVIVRPVDNYGFPTALRITVGTPQENERLVAVLREVL